MSQKFEQELAKIKQFAKQISNDGEKFQFADLCE